jgi:hypothetical protein
MTAVTSRLRCVLCCRKCFTCDEEPKVKERNTFHISISKQHKLGEGEKSMGRLGHYANKQCSVCMVALCTKKHRFPNVRKTCWELWHTVPDLECGVCETLCHVKNPREELQLETKTPPIRAAPAVSHDSSRKKGKRKGLTVVGYGLQPVRKSKRVSASA